MHTQDAQRQNHRVTLNSNNNLAVGIASAFKLDWAGGK